VQGLLRVAPTFLSAGYRNIPVPSGIRIDFLLIRRESLTSALGVTRIPTVSARWYQSRQSELE
jgi:hypothetical protein